MIGIRDAFLVVSLKWPLLFVGHVDAEEVVKQERIIAFSPVVKKDQRVNLILNYRHAMDFPDDHLGAFVIRLV